LSFFEWKNGTLEAIDESNKHWIETQFTVVAVILHQSIRKPYIPQEINTMLMKFPLEHHLNVKGLW
jgi:hypothetical protein